MGRRPHEEGSSKAPQAGCGEQLMQCCLVALGAVRTWDKSWDSDYAGAPPADKSGAEPRSGAKWFDDIMNSGSANAGASTAALPASSSDGAAAAPAGWVVMEWRGRKYHWNQLTGETRWAQQPEPEPEPQAEQSVPAPTTAAEAAELARLYSDEVTPPSDNHTKWYWAMAHAGADYWGGCPARTR